MFQSNELKVGFLALLAFLILYFGFNFLKGNDVFSSSRIYYVEYENVDGLMVSNQVMVNGIEVGKVKKVEIQPTKANKILVTLRFSQDIVIPDKTVAVLSDGALLGGKIIRLRLEGKGNLAEESFLKGETEVGVTALLKERAIPVIANADSLLVSFRQISNKFDHTGTYLNTLLKTSNETVSNINGSVNGIVTDNRANIAQISANMKTLSTDLMETEKQLRPLLTKFNTVADSLNALKIGKTLKEVDATVLSLKKIVQGLERGEGTAGKLIKNDSLYLGLNKTLIDLDKLLLDFRLQPKRYIGISVFGKKNTPPSN
ncbi:MCE family protein [Aquirufa antheringensis]|jgi:phospholipid/cholesterol/gamma-HCH transport system substrate-binding protein|uniref:MCE family protein n=1 Tax=Aquirufa antheringensis TaxID=2516559 RepID=A0A4Q9BGR3_9BACT|nr:MlaD family protein [Aquirufa antheringensis]MCZ2477574.1 MCE family protein [Aquirufa antheringensis]MCZ2485188.1 MCE family protein [Aquirufa antheringensis]MCZ2487370.1 MCE family protein [Aquirufa antheringensis]MCZ2490335.1 MCE family protein [Aquirufa antheringensis]TBH75489.1 MCE family protein [Aquirufa antheringensis]